MSLNCHHSCCRNRRRIGRVRAIPLTQSSASIFQTPDQFLGRKKALVGCLSLKLANKICNELIGRRRNTHLLAKPDNLAVHIADLCRASGTQILECAGAGCRIYFHHRFCGAQYDGIEQRQDRGDQAGGRLQRWRAGVVQPCVKSHIPLASIVQNTNAVCDT